MKRFWIDRTAIVTTLVGIILMAFTLHWRINPFEGSVVPEFLTSSLVGMTVSWVLVVTCMPVWIAAVSISMTFPLPSSQQWFIACRAMLVIQGVVYFMIGKLIALSLRKINRRKPSPNISVEAKEHGAP